MLDERRLKAIEMLVSGNHTITAIAKEVGVTRKTLYSWMDKDDFKAKLHEMQELKDMTIREGVKGDAENNIKILKKLRDSAKNEMVKFQSAKQLLDYAGWHSNQKHEITFKDDDSEAKNAMLDMLQQSKDNEDSSSAPEVEEKTSEEEEKDNS